VSSASISIVTPTLNAEQYLAECLASVAEQRCDGLEHLIVDGGSTDASRSMATQAGARWIARPGLGQAGAINVGLREATGDIVAWLNADDLYPPGSLARVRARLAAEPTLDVLYGDCDVVDARGRFLWRQQPGQYNFERLLKRGNSLAQPAVFLRRRVMDQVGFLDESLDYGMDYEFWLRLRGLRIAYEPQVLATFRWHTASKTATHSEANWRELITIVRRHGGGWTPYLVWSFARARVTVARLRMQRALSWPARTSIR